MTCTCCAAPVDEIESWEGLQRGCVAELLRHGDEGADDEEPPTDEDPGVAGWRWQ